MTVIEVKPHRWGGKSLKDLLPEVSQRIDLV